MISHMNMLLEDTIIVLGFRNMFLSIGKIGHEGPSTVLEDMENWFEFVFCAHFHDLEASLVIILCRFNQIGDSGSCVIGQPNGCVILNILGYSSEKRYTIDVHDINIEAYIVLDIIYS